MVHLRMSTLYTRIHLFFLIFFFTPAWGMLTRKHASPSSTHHKSLQLLEKEFSYYTASISYNDFFALTPAIENFMRSETMQKEFKAVDLGDKSVLRYRWVQLLLVNNHIELRPEIRKDIFLNALPKTHFLATPHDAEPYIQNKTIKFGIFAFESVRTVMIVSAADTEAGYAFIAPHGENPYQIARELGIKKPFVLGMPMPKHCGEHTIFKMHLCKAIEDFECADTWFSKKVLNAQNLSNIMERMPRYYRKNPKTGVYGLRTRTEIIRYTQNCFVSCVAKYSSFMKNCVTLTHLPLQPTQ